MAKKEIENLINKNWGVFEIALDKLYSWKIGDLNVWCRKGTGEIQIAHQYSDSTVDNQELIEPPEDISWSRWALKKDKIEIQLSPQLPDRPVVVKPESSFRIIIGAQAKIYIRVPLWLRINLSTKPSEKLLEIPAVVLSNTWFGTFFEGELCYWISTGARRQIEPDANRPYLAICPIQLINNAEEELLVEKICLRVANLSLFSDGVQLWSDETNVFYKGGNGISQVKASGVPPKEARSAKLISSPRNPKKKSLAMKTFASIRELPGLGVPTN